MTISPKARFKQDEADVKKLANLARDDSFHRALDYAYLAYVKELTKVVAGDLTSSAVAFHQIKGATEYINALLNLHEMPQVTERQPLGNLNNKV
jgi:hypothetical protein